MILKRWDQCDRNLFFRLRKQLVGVKTPEEAD
jgi:hypothetical protein